MLGVYVGFVLWISFKLYQEFGWKIYKKIGADPNMKSTNLTIFFDYLEMYLNYQMFLVLLKLDVYFFGAFIAQFLILLKRDDPEFYLSIAIIPMVLAFLFLAVYGVLWFDVGLNFDSCSKS